MRTSTLAELVDIYPTIVDLAGVSPPTGVKLDGVSLGWSLRPGMDWRQGKPAALSIFPRCPLNQSSATWITDPTYQWMNNWCEFVDRSEIPWMGYSMRTARWRYTEWAAFNGTSEMPIWTKLAGQELYDHSIAECFDCTENTNLAHDPTYSDVTKQLSAQLHALVDSLTNQFI